MKPRIPSIARLSLPLATALAALLAAQSVQAVDYFWDPALSNANTGSGTGVWNAANTNWFNGTTDVIWATANRPVFGGADGPFGVTVADNFSTTGLLFNKTAYTLSAASAQTITTAGSVALASGVTATIGSNVTVTRAANDLITTVSGAGGILNIGGADQLSTNAKYVNSQAGSTGGRTLIIEKGTTVNVNNGGYLGDSSATNYTTTNVNGITVGVGNSAAGGTLVVKPGGTVTAGNNTQVIVGLAVTASGTLTIDGGEVNGGAITTLSGGGTLPPANYGGLRFGAGTLNTSGTRIANLNGGTLTVGQVFAGTGSGMTNIFNFNGGTLKAIISNTTFMTGLTAANVQADGANIDSNNFDITIGQVLLTASAGGGLTKSSAGTLTLTGLNTYTGGTIISGGTLKLSSSGKLGYTSGTTGIYAGAMSIASGATFENASSGSQTLSGAITGAITGDGTLTNSGGGGLILSNAGNSFGALNISNANSRVFINTNAGALPAAATVNIASGALVFAVPATRANAITVSSGGALSAREVTTLSNVTLPGTGSVVFNNDDANTNLLTINNGQTLTDALTVQIGGSRMAVLTTALGGVTLAGNLTGIGGLVVASSGNFTNNPTLFGTGVLTLSGANDYTGPTTVTAGTLAVTGSLGATAVTVSSPAILGGNGNIGGNVTIGSGATHALAVAATPGTQVTRAITGTLTLTAGNLLELTAAATPAAGVYVLATATTISGSPTTIDYNGITGTVSIDTVSNPDRLLLTVAGAANDYASWANDPTKGNIPGEPASGDFDNDGITNIVEYALGMNPRVSSQPAGVLASNVIIYTKGADAIANGDVSWVIETSQTLAAGSWTPQVTQPAADPALTIAYTLTPGTPAKNFARLKVVQVP